MKNIKLNISAVALVAIMALFSSCKVTTTLPLMVTDNSTGSKTGEAKVVVGIFGKKDIDVSIARAAEDGGITKIATVDFKTITTPFKTTYITIVTGE